jgi:hypothetical protein
MEIVAQILKRRGKWMRRPECVVYVEVCDGIAVGAMVRVATAGALELFPPSFQLRLQAGLTLSADTVTGLLRTSSCSVSMTGPGRGRCRGLQGRARCVLAKEHMGALLEAAVHECSRGGVLGCWNWSEAGHVLAEVSDEKRCVHWVGTRG